MTQPKIKRLFLDIETSPNVVYSWRVGYNISINYENILKERAIICVGYKWEGQDRVNILTWNDGDDKQLLKTFIPILESADEVVAHYGDKFDLPWIRARAAFHGFSVSPYIKSVDTKQRAAKAFYFNSNRLDYVAQFLGLGKKIETDFDLWKEVVAGNKTALKEMVAYCKKDVALLEKVYERLETYYKPKTHVGVLLGGEKRSCSRCGSSDTQSRGTRVTGAGSVSRILYCKTCGGWSSTNRREAEKGETPIEAN